MWMVRKWKLFGSDTYENKTNTHDEEKRMSEMISPILIDKFLFLESFLQQLTGASAQTVAR